MFDELPVFKKCCVCFPLRYGLITWGYIRTITVFLLLLGAVGFFFGFLHSAIFKKHPNYYYTTVTIILGFLVVLTLADFLLNIVFIIGGNKKSLKLLRAYYIYSLVLCILTTLIGVTYSIYTFISLDLEKMTLMFEVACLLTQILIQAYVILLVRSEIIKLRSNCKFKFYNNAADSECTMRCEEETVNREEET